MVLPLAALGALSKRVLLWLGIAGGAGAVAVAGPELFASDQRGARETNAEENDVTFPTHAVAKTD